MSRIGKINEKNYALSAQNFFSRKLFQNLYSDLQFYRCFELVFYSVEDLFLIYKTVYKPVYKTVYKPILRARVRKGKGKGI